MVQVRDSRWEAFCGGEEGGEEVKLGICGPYTTIPPLDNHRSGALPGTVDARCGKNITFFAKNLTAKN